MITLPRAEAWLYSQLAPDATLSGLVGGRIYARQVPQGSDYPLLVYQWAGAGSWLQTLNGIDIWSSLTYDIKGIGRDTKSLEPILNRADGLLHRASGSVSGALILNCRKQREFEYPEPTDQGTYWHVGLTYELKVQPGGSPP